MSYTNFIAYDIAAANRVKATWLNDVNKNSYGVTNVAGLTALTGMDGPITVQTKGYYSAGDGGAGLYRWDSASVLADNGGTVLEPDAGGTGRWILMHNGWVGMGQFGVLFSNDISHATVNRAAWLRAVGAAVQTTTGFALMLAWGTCYLDAGISYDEQNNLTIIGPSFFGCTLKCATAGAYFFEWRNSARHVHRNYGIDGNLLANVNRKFIATATCGSHMFDTIQQTGALVTGDDFVDAGVGPNDIAHNYFLNNFWSNRSPSNAQIQIDADNCVDNTWEGGRCVMADGAPKNVKISVGQFAAKGLFFAGATQYDIEAAGGQVCLDRCDSESEAFLHTLGTDTSGQSTAIHTITGGSQLRTLNTTLTHSIYHESARKLSISDVYCNDDILVGKAGGVGLPSPTLQRSGAISFAAGADVVLQTNGSDYVILPSNNSTRTTNAIDIDGLSANIVAPASVGTLPNNDTTPSVNNGWVWQASNTNPTSITTLDDGVEGVEYTIVATNNNTTFVDGATMRLAGSINFNIQTQSSIKFTLVGGVYYETGRSVN